MKSTTRENMTATNSSMADGNQFTDQRERLEVIDTTFSNIGFEKVFLDPPGTRARPNIRVEESAMPLILHIDDDEHLVDALTARLESRGMRVTCALDGAMGLQSALMFPVDCIVLDYDMPKVKGDHVIAQLKIDPRTVGIPIVVLTAINKDSLRTKMLGMGADVFMTKPFEFAKLHREILNLIKPKGLPQMASPTRD